MLDDAGWAEQRGAEASAAVEHAAAPGAQHPKSSRGLLRPGEQRGAGALFGFLTANPATFPVRTQCRLLGISPSGYHTWRRRPPSARAKGDSALSERVRAIYARSRGTYGVPRGHAGLAAQGTRVGHKRIARLICADRLAGVWCRKAFHTTVRVRDVGRAADLARRNYTAPAPDRLWVAEITCLPAWAGFLCLPVVVDAFSRRVVRRAMAENLRTELVLAALEPALGQRHPEKVTHHCDHGCQYNSPSPSAAAAVSRAFAPPWVRLGTPKTMPCARASSPPSSTSSSTRRPSQSPAWQCRRRASSPMPEDSARPPCMFSGCAGSTLRWNRPATPRRSMD